MKKRIISILILLTLLFKVQDARALSASVSKTSVTVGNSVVLTLDVNGYAGYISASSSNTAVLSGGFGKTWFENEKPTFIFKSLAPGTATITVSGTAANKNAVDEKLYKTFTITVKAKPVVILSNDNSLSSLGVDGITLSPEFNKDTLEYKAELEPDTTKINVAATPNHGGASISGTGERDVVDGDNRLEIVVTAENGAQRTYVINASVKEYDPIIVKVDNKDYTVIRKKSALTAPNNYVETTVKIGENEVPAFKSDITGLVLVGLKDESGTPNLYSYKDGKYNLYKEYAFNKVILYPMELKEVPENYKKTTITYNDEKITAYKIKETSKYALIYGMNIETGETNLYMHDSNEDTLQIYNTEEIDMLKSQNNLYLKIMIGLGSLSLVLIIISIARFIKNNKKTKQVENSN